MGWWWSAPQGIRQSHRHRRHLDQWSTINGLTRGSTIPVAVGRLRRTEAILRKVFSERPSGSSDPGTSTLSTTSGGNCSSINTWRTRVLLIPSALAIASIDPASPDSSIAW